jgi:hypothetical protein
MKLKMIAATIAAVLFCFACNKIDSDRLFVKDAKANDRVPIMLTEAIPLGYNNYVLWWFSNCQCYKYGCVGMGWECGPTAMAPSSGWFDEPVGSFSWPLISTADCDNCPLVDLQWETDGSLKMRILSELPTFDEVLEVAEGDAEVAQRIYDLIYRQVEVKKPVILDRAICEMLFEDYNGQKIVLQPGEYAISYDGEANGEVVIPVEIY